MSQLLPLALILLIAPAMQLPPPYGRRQRRSRRPPADGCAHLFNSHRQGVFLPMAVLLVVGATVARTILRRERG